MTDNHPAVSKEHTERPWGAYRVLADAANGGEQPVAVKILTISAGKRLSLQSHEQRMEEWTPLHPGLQAQIGDTVYDLEPFVTYRVGLGQLHRIINPGNVDGQIVEVMFGHYDEDDIERFEDDFGRA